MTTDGGFTTVFGCEREAGLWFTIADVATIDEAVAERVRRGVASGYGP